MTWEFDLLFKGAVVSGPDRRLRRPLPRVPVLLGGAGEARVPRGDEEAAADRRELSVHPSLSLFLHRQTTEQNLNIDDAHPLSLFRSHTHFVFYGR